MPDFGLSGDWRNGADLLLFQGVDDTALPDIWVSDETDGDLLLVRVEDGKLPEQLDEGTFTEGIVDGGVECDGGRGEGEMLDPTSLSRATEMWSDPSSANMSKVAHKQTGLKN